MLFWEGVLFILIDEINYLLLCSCLSKNSPEIRIYACCCSLVHAGGLGRIQKGQAWVQGGIRGSCSSKINSFDLCNLLEGGELGHPSLAGGDCRHLT